MKASPAFQLYAQDFLVGTAELTAEEVGAYIRLLCYQWVKGGLPNDENKLAHLAGLTEISGGLSLGYVLGNVLVKFRLSPEDNLWRNERLEVVRREQAEYREKQANNGKGGGNPNFKKGKKNPYYDDDQTLTKDNPPHNPQDNPVDKRPHNPKITSSSSSSSSSNNKEGEEVVEAWNQSEFPKCMSISIKRKASIKQRMADPFFSQKWREALDRIKTSAFCTGKNDRGWKADIDWFLKPDSVVRIMEGKYDNRNGNSQTQQKFRMFNPEQGVKGEA